LTDGRLPDGSLAACHNQNHIIKEPLIKSSSRTRGPS